MSVTRVRTSSGWADLSKTGPQGPPGPVGPPGPTGTWLAVQHIDGGGAEVAAPATGTEVGRNGPGTDWRLIYTPAVNCWWNVIYNIGQIQKTVSGWAYCYLDLALLAGSAPIPAVPGMVGVASGGLVARNINTAYGPSGSDYTTLAIHKRLPLSAGGTYTLQPFWSATGTGWLINHSAATFWAQAEAYPR
jgi:hypothetical protein